MRIIGYCERCHRIKTVRVRYPRPGAVQTGVCDDCENRR